jgi:hypothetical protein
MRHAAYGLDLLASFPLPGMPGVAGRESPDSPAAAADELPALALELCKPAELQDAWSGSSEPPQWRGRQGDGLDLALERGAAGDVRFSYGERAPSDDDRARFLLHTGMGHLDCAPTQSDLSWQRVLIGKVLPAIAVLCGYEALHAAVVDSPAGVVAIMAPSGMGKSTLALELLRRGWPLFADDQLTLDRGAGGVRAHPGTPHMNLATDLPDGIDPQALGATLGILAGERWLAAHATTRRPRPVRALCLLERGPGLPLQAATLAASPLPLAPYVLGLESDTARLGSRFGLYADLMESATLVRLTAGLEHRPAQLADVLERTLLAQAPPGRPELVAGGVA